MAVKVHTFKFSLTVKPKYFNPSFHVEVAIPIDTACEPRVAAKLCEFVTGPLQKIRDKLDESCATLDDVLRVKDADIRKCVELGFMDWQVYVDAERMRARAIEDQRKLLKQYETQLIAETPKRVEAYWKSLSADKWDKRWLQYKAVVKCSFAIFSSAAVLGGVVAGVVTGPPGWTASLFALMSSVTFTLNTIKAVGALSSKEFKVRAEIAAQMVVVEHELKVKAAKGDPSRLDKIKTLFKTDQVKKLVGLVELHRLKLTETDKGIDNVAKGIDKILESNAKARALAEKVKSKTADEVDQELAGVETAAAQLLAKIDGLNADLKKCVAANQQARKFLQSIAKGEEPGGGGLAAKGLDLTVLLTQVYGAARGIVKMLTPLAGKYK